MPRLAKAVPNRELLTAALDGLQLQRQKIDDQIRQVRALLGVRRGRPPAAQAAPKPVAKRRTLSAEARKRIAQAQKRRWAEFRKKEEAGA